MKWNPRLDLAALGREYAATGRVVVKAALEPSAARELHRSAQYLTENDLWFQAHRGDPGYFNRRRRQDPAHYSYRFSKYPVSNISLDDLVGIEVGDSRRQDLHDPLEHPEAPEEELPADHPLLEARAFLNSRTCLDAIAEITGDDLREDGTLCYLSRFMPGDYLAIHHDGVITDSGSVRRCAFVLNLTRRWLPHWGGQTLFPDPDGGPTSLALTPSFNSLLLFRVPMWHCVTPVSLHSPEPRLALTGWFYDAPL